jgi:hypothetical protein
MENKFIYILKSFLNNWDVSFTENATYPTWMVILAA